MATSPTTKASADHPDPAHDAPAPAAAPAPDPAVLAAQKEAQAAGSIGAQIILDYNEEGSLGARGGAGADIVENTMARDAHLVALGLDPLAPSGPPPSPPVLKAKQEAAAKAADPLFLPAQSGKATRVSSLAAGISSEDLPPPDTLAGAASGTDTTGGGTHRGGGTHGGTHTGGSTKAG